MYACTKDAMAVYAMGWGADGQLGLGNSSTSDKDIPKQLPLLDSKVRKLASSTDFTLALTGDYAKIERVPLTRINLKDNRSRKIMDLGQLRVWPGHDWSKSRQGNKTLLFTLRLFDCHLRRKTH